MISASVTAYLIWLFWIKTYFCIDFIAYNFPEAICLTLNTLPNEPSPNKHNNSKSLKKTGSLLIGGCSVRVALVETDDIVDSFGLENIRMDRRIDSAADNY